MAGVLRTWVVREWKRGWDKIPVVMACHCVTFPIFVGIVVYKIINFNSVLPAEKYRMMYTVVRPGDARIARINKESRIDETGFLWPKLPYYQYPMK